MSADRGAWFLQFYVTGGAGSRARQAGHCDVAFRQAAPGYDLLQGIDAPEFMPNGGAAAPRVWLRREAGE